MRPKGVRTFKFLGMFCKNREKLDKALKVQKFGSMIRGIELAPPSFDAVDCIYDPVLVLSGQLS